MTLEIDKNGTRIFVLAREMEKTIEALRKQLQELSYLGVKWNTSEDEPDSDEQK